MDLDSGEVDGLQSARVGAVGEEINVDKEELIDKVTDISSYEYMSGMKDKFRFNKIYKMWLQQYPDVKKEYFGDDGMRRDGSGGTIEYPGISNVNIGKQGRGKIVLSDELIERCNREWIDKMKDKTGTTGYEEFREKFSFLTA